jgi:hypothetical protein
VIDVLRVHAGGLHYGRVAAAVGRDDYLCMTRPDRGYDCALAQEPAVRQSTQGARWDIRDTAAYIRGRTNIADGVCNIAIDAVENRIPLCADL